MRKNRSRKTRHVYKKRSKKTRHTNKKRLKKTRQNKKRLKKTRQNKKRSRSHSYKKRNTKRRRKQAKHRGGFSVPLTPANFSPMIAKPPNGGVQVPNPGVTGVVSSTAGQKYYYAKNNRVFGNPLTTNRAMTGGKGRRKRKCGCQKGGGLSGIIESIPGGSDLRDVYYKAGNMMGSAWSQYNGYGATNEPPMTNYTTGQPIAKSMHTSDSSIPIGAYMADAGAQVSKSPYTTGY
jgi:hypothetical protein